MKITKMILLDKFKDNAINEGDYLLVADLQDFVGTEKYSFVGNEYVSDGEIAEIVLDEESETLSIDGVTSFYDDFDFDFNIVEGVEVPFGVYVLGIDPSVGAETPEEPETPEDPEEPETPEDPEEPETPEDPEEPETPETPETPEDPEEPETP